MIFKIYMEYDCKATVLFWWLFSHLWELSILSIVENVLDAAFEVHEGR